MLIFYIYHSIMWIKNTMLSIAASASILAWASECIGRNETKWADLKLSQTEQVKIPQLQDSVATDIQDWVKNQIFVCLENDENSYTHTKVLESIEDPQNTVLEYPIAQLFEKYWKTNSAHPLKMSWVAPRFRSLLWKWWIEASDTPQKLNPREDDITSETLYEIWDTLSFRLIDPRLDGIFPEYLSDQLKEPGFDTFYDKDSLLVQKHSENDINSFKQYLLDKNNFLKIDDSKLEDENHIYDTVVKSIPWWNAALSLYRDWKLFMDTYVSVWTPGRKTRMWQFEIIWKYPYKRSRKYNNSAMPLALNYDGWFYFHQWNVTWKPLSHWCIRLPWVYADVLYSLLKDKEHVDVFIDKNLYESK